MSKLPNNKINFPRRMADPETEIVTRIGNLGATQGQISCKLGVNQGQLKGNIGTIFSSLYLFFFNFDSFFSEIQKNLTQVVFANENVPKLPNNEIGTHRFPEENGRNSGNGNSGNQNRKQFQQSRSQTKSSSDVKSFNRNGDNDSPFDKRLSSNAGMYKVLWLNFHVQSDYAHPKCPLHCCLPIRI